MLATELELPQLPVTPAGLGLDPGKFPVWRPGQPETVLKLARWFLDPDGKKVLFLEAPTGVGKSLIAAALAAYLYKHDLDHSPNHDHDSTIITTITRALQSQYMDDTIAGMLVKRGTGDWSENELGLPVFTGVDGLPMRYGSAWGKQGHPCLLVPTATADQGPCTNGLKCDMKGQCQYYVERDRAQEAHLAVLNTAMYLTMVNFVRAPEELRGRGAEPVMMFDQSALAIHDEGHDIERAIRGLVEVRLYHRWFAEAGLPPLPATKDSDTWLDYIDAHMETVSSIAGEAQRQARLRARRNPPEVLEDEVLGKAQQVHRAFTLLYHTLIPSKPLITFEDNARGFGRHVLFRPVWGAAFANHMLFRHAHKHILMSATFPHPEYTAETLGLEPGDWDFIKLPNPFAAGRRRIVYDGQVKMNARTPQSEVLRMIEAMDNVLDQHADQKGIIHSVSYDRARLIMQHSRHARRMISHDQRQRNSKQQAIDIYLAAQDPVILVSPAVGVGEDFGRGDNCRFQVFIKYPIPYLGDPVTKARSEENPNSLWFEADIAFIQAVGRGTRSADDWCVSYVLDKGAAFRLGKLPADIQQAIVRR